ncbi:alpha/beta hydrolase [Deinococcus sp.]|uniref:alpha/beta hydrolase n=1 Tax=Deinococcus sp. TaxID=47478 RepID=UPI003C7D2082
MRRNVRLAAVFLVGLGLFGAAGGQSSSPPALRAARFSASETVVTFMNGGQKVVGTLTTPGGASGLLPVVLMLHGFGSTRQELPIKNTQEAIFSRTARVLAEQGYATLRIDFRGSGESGGIWPDTTFSSQISDAHAALAFLGTQPQLDGNRIGVLGLSQGGLVAAVTAASEPRVKSLVLWSPVAIPAQTFGDLFGKDTVAKGLASGGQPITFKLPWGAEVTLKTGYFEDLFNVDPLAEITKYNRPMLVVVGLKDTTVTPQPQSGQLYLKYHPGQEKLVKLDADHVFGSLDVGPERLDEAIAWSADWLSGTLK